MPPVQVGVVEWFADFTVAGVADNGTVIGHRVAPDPVEGLRAAIWRPGAAAPEDLSTAEGVAARASVTTASWRWGPAAGSATAAPRPSGFPGDGSFWAGAVSRLGDATGTSAPPGAPDGAFRPVVWPAGSIEPVALGPTACWLAVRAVSASGAVDGGVPGSATTSCAPPTGAAPWRVRIR